MDALKVIQPGPFSTVQDLGRFGSQRFGVPVSGALDGYAHRVANLLVGNPEEAACLEMTFMGAKFEALNALIVAVCGAEAPVSVNGDPREGWSAITLKPGDVLSVGMAQKGLRSYLAIGGGIDVPLVMGSRSTYIGGALGGFKGRILQKGDILPGGEPNPQAGGAALPVEFRPVYSPRKTLRALPGPQDEFFSEGLKVFFSSDYLVDTKSDRMACRLSGPVVELKENAPKSIISEPSLPGGVQIPAVGEPIVLLVEQTVGGYAKIATVVSSDLDALAQARPGETVNFEKVNLEQARKLFEENQKRMAAARSVLSS